MSWAAAAAQDNAAVGLTDTDHTDERYAAMPCIVWFHRRFALQGVQPGALVIANGLEGHSMQSVASPKLAQAAQATAQTSSSSMNPQAAQEAHALANASETLKAQAQTLKVL